MNAPDRRPERALLCALEARHPATLESHRLAALTALDALPAGSISPTLAAALLDVTRLGGLESEVGAHSQAELKALVEARRTLARIAVRGADQTGAACLLPDGGRWAPAYVERARLPWYVPRAVTTLVDYGRHRADELAAELAALVERAGEPGYLHVARTRFSRSRAALPHAWRFGLKATVAALALKGPGPTLRWAAVAKDAVASLDTLPADVRLLVVERGATLPEGLAHGWEVSIGGPPNDAAARVRSGQRLCLIVDGWRAAAESVARFDAGDGQVVARTPRRRTLRRVRPQQVGLPGTGTEAARVG